MEHNIALARVVLGLMQDDAELSKEFRYSESFPRWLTDTAFGLTRQTGHIIGDDDDSATTFDPK